MRLFKFSAFTAIAIALGACGSTGGTPDPVVNAPGPSAAALNTTLGPLSYGNPRKGVSVSESFAAATSALTVSSNGAGYEYAGQSRGDYTNAGIARFDKASNSLTLEITQDDIAIQDTIGPLLLADPGEFENLENNDLAILIAARPEIFPAGYGVDPSDYAGNPEAADLMLTALGENPDESAGDYLAVLSAIAEEMKDADFFEYEGANGIRYAQLKTTGTNSGITTNYVALGAWRNVAPADGFPGDEVLGATVWGKLTPPGEIPATGTANYSSSIVGWLLRQNQIEQLRGGFNVNVDFASGAITSAVDADIVVFDVNGEPLLADLTEMTGTGQIVEGANHFRGTLRGVNDPGLEGAFQGGFYGPDAAEIGGTFDFTSEDYAGSGAFVGSQ